MTEMSKEGIATWLNERYEMAMTKASGADKADAELPPKVKDWVRQIVELAEVSKSGYTVALTCLTYKMLNPEQDIRRHQSSISGGFSGRTFDAHNITPFLRRNNFPCMQVSGWLTRSFEHKSPYDANYNGAIKPQKLKEVFLSIIDVIQNTPEHNEKLLDFFLQCLIIDRDKKLIVPSIPRNLSIRDTVCLLDAHFHKKYNAQGAARLPVLALYSVYECLFAEGQRRFASKKLLPLESHNSADAQSGRIGDIDIVDEGGKPFEAVEVKFDIAVSADIVEVAKQKILQSPVSRYYILSTVEPSPADSDYINTTVSQIAKTHGCQLIINGVLPTIQYYLRLLSSPVSFVENYAKLTFSDSAVKFEHRQMWNELVAKA